jgi:DNA modification methylase
MVNRGWILRNTIIWYKPNCMPASVKDRFTVDFEYMFFFVKNKRYYFEQQFDDIQESTKERYKYGWNGNQDRSYINGPQNNISKYMNTEKEKSEKRNKRCVWEITTKPFSKAHFAVFPKELIETCILAGCPESGIVYDPFMGSGTTANVAIRSGRKWIGSELNREYINIANELLEEAEESVSLLRLAE